MIQDLIAYSIIIGALATFTYRILGFFNLVGKKTARPGNCAGCSGGCEIKQTSVILNEKIKKWNKYDAVKIIVSS
jgi:anaerobic selenocysteine-containing dehydrogenase